MRVWGEEREGLYEHSWGKQTLFSASIFTKKMSLKERKDISFIYIDEC